ncbi:hypothetical protein [Streptomyces sp. NPDC057694]|uniref:hypothetical protein n=1 Tax=Streptomyces sp. NPDC057694 TaxID=3346216 RepID=UPI00367DDE91
MNRQAPRSATILYSIAATCAVIGALLWVRSRTGSTLLLYSGSYGSSFDADGYSPSAWQVWSSDLPDSRLALYLLGSAIVLAVAARLVSVWRD